MMIWLILPGLVLGAFALTAGLRRYALSRQLVDVPNLRSSHTTPTPRGRGGDCDLLPARIAAFVFFRLSG